MRNYDQWKTASPYDDDVDYCGLAEKREFKHCRKIKSKGILVVRREELGRLDIEEDDVYIPCCAMNRIFDSNEQGGMYAFIFKASSVRWSDSKIIEKMGLITYSGGPGRYFTNEAFVERKGSRVIVKQIWGYDV